MSLQEKKQLSNLCAKTQHFEKNPSIELDNDNIRNDYYPLQDFVLRHLTFKYTCPLTVLYGAVVAGTTSYEYH